MNKIKKTLVLFGMLFSATQSYANPITCPPASMVRAAQFVRVIAYDKSIDLWEVMTQPFMHDGVQWDIAFGKEFPGVKDPDEALTAAQESYKSSPIVNESPETIDIPGHILCDYTHEGMEYWIQAMSPPGD